jgi:hypothetical protein
MRNQNGMTFPLTIMVCMFLMLVLFHIIHSYRLESKFLVEREQFEQLQSLIQMGSIDVVNELATSPNHLLQGRYRYPNGYVNYVTSAISLEVIQVSLTAITNSARKKTVLFQYDIPKKALVKWAEG